MPAPRALLARVQRLERGRDPPALAYLGSDDFEAQVRADVEAGKLDRIDMLGENGQGGVLACLKRWTREKVWLGR